MAQASITSLRLLKTARSSGEPLAGSNCSRVSGAMGAEVPACMMFLGQAQVTVCTPRGPASASRPGPALADRGGRGRPLDLQGGEARAVVAAGEHVPGLADDDDAAALVERAGRQADAHAGGDALPGGAGIGAANDVAAQAVADHGPALADQAEQGAGVGQRHRARSGRCRDRASAPGPARRRRTARRRCGAPRTGAGSWGCRPRASAAPSSCRRRRCAAPGRRRRRRSRCVSSSNQTSRNGFSAPCAAKRCASASHLASPLRV